MTNYLDYHVETAHACSLEGVHIYCGPHEYPSTPDTLYRNNGDGTFTDVTARSGLRNAGKGLGTLFTDETGRAEPSFAQLGFGTQFLDADNNGTLELFVANGHVWDNVAQITPPSLTNSHVKSFGTPGQGTSVMCLKQQERFSHVPLLGAAQPSVTTITMAIRRYSSPVVVKPQCYSETIPKQETTG